MCRQKKRRADGYVGGSRDWFGVVEDWILLSNQVRLSAVCHTRHLEGQPRTLSCVLQAEKIAAGFGDEAAVAASEAEAAAAKDKGDDPVDEVISVCVTNDIPNDDVSHSLTPHPSLASQVFFVVIAGAVISDLNECSCEDQLYAIEATCHPLAPAKYICSLCLVLDQSILLGTGIIVLSAYSECYFRESWS